ncbi:(2Fe-2S)-binding protein [bacterium]|nr:(2Fe-2S)-binding protein [bacterium]NUN46733.1 (2Fe-2S)-binding protein [bacterium]
MKSLITLKVNGDLYEIAVKSNRTLLEALRYDCHLTGSKQGCDMGDCGACTVLIDNVPIQACITLAVECVGKEIITVEGIAKGTEAHPLQTAWNNQGASQCGYCTPGFMVVAKWLLEKNPNPSDVEIKEALSGNICRCTGYTKIITAMKEAAAIMQKEKAV